VGDKEDSLDPRKVEGGKTTDHKYALQAECSDLGWKESALALAHSASQPIRQRQEHRAEDSIVCRALITFGTRDCAAKLDAFVATRASI